MDSASFIPYSNILTMRFDQALSPKTPEARFTAAQWLVRIEMEMAGKLVPRKERMQVHLVPPTATTLSTWKSHLSDLLSLLNMTH